MKNALKRSLSVLLAITIIFSSAYVGLGEIDFSGLFAVKAEAADYSEIYKDELVFMDSTTAKAFIGFIYNVPTDKVSTDEKSIDIIYNYLTGSYTKGTLEYIYAQSIFLLTAEEFINRNLNESEKVFTISTQNLIDALEEEVGSDPNVSEDVLNEAVGGVKGHIKKILYYVGEFDLDDTMTAIDTAMSGYQTITGIEGKVEDLVLAVKSIVNTTFAVTSNNAYKSYQYYSVYLNNRNVGAIAIEPLIELLMVDTNIFDGLVNIFDSLGFGNSWTNEEIQYLIRTFAEFTYHSKCELQSISASEEIIAVTNVSFTCGSYELAMNQTLKTYATVYPENASDTSLTYSSSNNSVIAVESDGTVTPVGEGTANVIATANNSVQGFCEITVYPYDISENDTGYTIDVYLGSGTEVVIPGSINDVAVTCIEDGAFEEKTNFSSITIPNSVTTIGDSAFGGCTNLISVTIGNGVTDIGAWAFASCDNLKSVYITDIAAWCEIEFGYLAANPLHNGGSLYLNGELITNLVIPNSVTRIGSCAFDGYKGLTDVTIPNSVTSIGDSAFSSCSNLVSVTIGDNVTRIGDGAFQYCRKLDSVYITDIASWCNIVFEDYSANPLWFTSNLYLNNELVTNLEIPKGVTNIGNYTFEYCSNLTSITIPDGVTSIGDEAFRGCTNLSSITIPEGVTSIGHTAFEDCSSLSSIVIPNSVTSIGSMAFSRTNLTSVTIPENITIIDYGVFSGCENLVSVIVPDTVTNIGPSAFEGCLSLSSIAIPDSVTSIGDYSFADCISLTSINVGENNNNYCSLDGVLFNKDKTNLIQYPANKADTEYTIPNSVTSIKEKAFSGCSNLVSVTIPEGVITIPIGAFRDSTNLISVSIPDSVTGISADAFYGCTNLSSFTIPESVTSIGSYCFFGCESLTSITIPDGVTSIGGFTFYDCTNLKSITIPKDITNIGNYAFKGCNKLKYVFYSGSESDVPNITIGSSNESLTNAAIHYNATDHTYEYKVDAEPTCTEKGSKHQECTVCGYSLEAEEISAHGHSYSTEWTIDVAPTCTEEGSKSHHCTICGDKADITVIAANGHNYEVINIESSHPHTTKYKCTDCKLIKFETVGYSDCSDCTDEADAPIIATTDSQIDYDNLIILTSIQNADDIFDILGVSENVSVIVNVSHAYGNLELYGTGTIITVFDGDEYIGDYTLIVEGDLDGDSVCDVLDAAQAQRYSAGFDEPTENEILAANGCISDEIDVNSYQNVVNTALAS